ncbi:receptor-like protein kinase FERONIA isoform X2 [Rhododendron vialii]|uniref:receptor-like protein kinase FERONIA isoform X2 n=1 Tax=Rhododendron vialii TaxID=182163 RepID=UPI00265EF07D|nr:receptor-like protein kinase FERONIA isoform X2 [Rhododendron vialii]
MIFRLTKKKKFPLNMAAQAEASYNATRNGAIHSEGFCRLFSLDEVLTATNNFDDTLVIGNGGFGKVYRGLITYLERGTGELRTMAAAIKRLNVESKQGAGEFWTEVKMLSKLQHTHLVSLIGYCNELSEMILLYEYIGRGTLADHLYKLTGSGQIVSPLTMEERLSICIGAARGLNYLHAGTITNQKFIHRDVKTTNILLDDNWVAKICDFGLSKGTTSYSITHVSTDVKGTFGYFDPEYFLTRRLTTKSDVYAFGVVLLEVLCGRPPVDTRLVEEQIGLVQWAQHCIKKGKLNGVIDPSLSGQIAPRCLKSFVELANKCLHKDRKSRPTMAEVLGSLELALVSQQKGRTEGIINRAFQTMDRWLRDRKDNGSSMGRSKVDVTLESDENSVTHSNGHYSFFEEVLRLTERNGNGSSGKESSEVIREIDNGPSMGQSKQGRRILVGADGFSDRAEANISPDSPEFASFGSEEGPGIEEFQIIGEAKPGYRLLGCGFPIRGTSLCMFQWVRHLQDGTRQYIEGATDSEYVVTADDVDKHIAVECIPMDDRGRQGKLVRLFANGQNKITCDPDIQLEIDTYVSKGEATFSILLLMDASETWEPITLVLKRSGYQIKDNRSQETLIAEKFSKDLSNA